MENDNFDELLEESSQIDEEFENLTEQLIVNAKIILLNNEKLQMQEEIAQIWNHLAESKSRQTMLEEELEKKNEIISSLSLINEQSMENLKKIRTHQNNMVDFISNLETSRNEVFEDFMLLKNSFQETFQELTDRVNNYRKEENEREAEILKLREEIRQRDEQLAIAMDTHCKDQQIITEINEKLKNYINDDKSTRDELEKSLSEYRQHEKIWKQEKDQLMKNIETMREKFTTDLINTKETMDSLSKLRHQEFTQFKAQLRVQLEKNSKLEEKLRNLENKQKENVDLNGSCTPPSAINNKRSTISSPYSDDEGSDTSIKATQEPIFKKRKFLYFEGNNDQHVINEDFFGRISPNTSVDSTSGPFDKDIKRPRQTV